MKVIKDNFLQQDVHSLPTCSWDHFESKSSNEHGSDLEQFVKEMRMSITVAVVVDQ